MLNTAAKNIQHRVLKPSACLYSYPKIDDSNTDINIVTIAAFMVAHSPVALPLPTARTASSGDIPHKHKVLRPSNLQ
jgi:hypothetical protein